MARARQAVPAKPEAGCSAIACRDCGIYQLCVPLGLKESDTRLLDRVVKRRQVFKRGEILFRYGEPLECVYAIRSGSVKTYVATSDGRVQITGFHVSGELLGLDALAGGRYGSEARALETTSVCEMAVARFDEVAREVPGLERQMIEIMSSEIQHHQELMLLLGRKSAEERLATYLLSLSRRFARRKYSPTQFNLSMSRSDIGSYLGVAEETVCRMLARFHGQGLITLERRHVVLRDLERLREIAHDRVAASARPRAPGSRAGSGMH